MPLFKLTPPISQIEMNLSSSRSQEKNKLKFRTRMTLELNKASSLSKIVLCVFICVSSITTKEDIQCTQEHKLSRNKDRQLSQITMLSFIFYRLISYSLFNSSKTSNLFVSSLSCSLLYCELNILIFD